MQHPVEFRRSPIRSDGKLKDLKINLIDHCQTAALLINLLIQRKYFMYVIDSLNRNFLIRTPLKTGKP